MQLMQWHTPNYNFDDSQYQEFDYNRNPPHDLWTWNVLNNLIRMVLHRGFEMELISEWITIDIWTGEFLTICIASRSLQKCRIQYTKYYL